MALRPCLRIDQPTPPPRVSPATPVWLTIPPVVARPCALRLEVDVAPQRTTLHPGPIAPVGIDPHAPHGGEGR